MSKPGHPSIHSRAKMNSKALIKSFYSANYNRYEIMAPNMYFHNFDSEMDIVGIRKSGYIDEIEVKISVSDFNNDFKKTVRDMTAPMVDFDHPKVLKHDEISAGRFACNYFAFLIPESILGKVEAPEYAGLYVMRDGGYIRSVKKCKLLHKRKATIEQKYAITKKLGFRYWDLYRK